MIRRADNVHVAYEPAQWGQGWLVLHVGKDHFRVRRIDRAQFRAIDRWATGAPQRIATVDKYSCWLYRGRYFWDDAGLVQHQVRAALEPRLAAV
jgi:hypothetical protein